MSSMVGIDGILDKSNDSSNHNIFIKSEFLDDSNAAMSGNDSNNEKFVETNDENSNHNLKKIKQEEMQNCYCGNERNLNLVEFQCAKCLKWFHNSCLSMKIGRAVPFMMTYIFYCRNCSVTGSETFKKTQTNFSQMCQTAIANLMQKNLLKNRIAFSKDKEIIPFLDANWDVLSNKQRPLKNTWHTSVFKIMQKDSDTFLCDNRDPDDVLFALRSMDLTKIAPNYEHLKNLKDFQNNLNSNANISSRSLRGVKKKAGLNEGATELSHINKRQKSELTQPKLPPSGFPSEYPFNKDGYRYILAEPDANAPFRKEYDESNDYVGRAVPTWLFRKLTPEKVDLAMNDRAHFLKILDDRRTVFGEKGYCSVRATSSVSHGIWFYEIRVNEMPDNSACRVGWAQELANLYTPIGYDKFGYSWRSRKGTKFHQSQGYRFSDIGYQEGDVIGCLIDLPFDETNPYARLPKTYKDKPLIKFKSYHYFEEKDDSIERAGNNLHSLDKAKIVYYRNGVRIGTAFENIYGGTYYPAIGLYKNVSITFNFGPDFWYPLTNESDPEYYGTYRGMNQVVFDSQIEQTLADLVYLVENEHKCNLESFYNS